MKKTAQKKKEYKQPQPKKEYKKPQPKQEYILPKKPAMKRVAPVPVDNPDLKVSVCVTRQMCATIADKFDKTTEIGFLFRTILRQTAAVLDTVL